MTLVPRAALFVAAFISTAFPVGAQPAKRERTETTEGGDLSKLPATRPYRSDQPVSRSYVVRERYRTGLVAAGGFLIGAFYAVPLIVAASTGFDDHSGYLAIPVAGPFLWGAARCEASEGEEETSRCSGLAASLLGLPQAAGFALLTTGALVKKKELVRRDLASTSLVPLWLGDRGAGVGIVHPW